MFVPQNFFLWFFPISMHDFLTKFNHIISELSVNWFRRKTRLTVDFGTSKRLNMWQTLVAFLSPYPLFFIVIIPGFFNSLQLTRNLSKNTDSPKWTSYDQDTGFGQETVFHIFLQHLLQRFHHKAHKHSRFLDTREEYKSLATRMKSKPRKLIKHKEEINSI